jgi:hypothetical protein
VIFPLDYALSHRQFSHLGLSRAASTSSLSYINAHRSSELFRDLYYELLNDFHVKTGDSTAAKWMDNPSLIKKPEFRSFFKDIKQLLKIKSFVGTSENAVKIQIWVALITILILKYLKHKAIYAWHLSNLVGFIRLNLFVKIDLFQWLNKPFEEDVGIKNSNQVGIQFEKHHTISITH